MRALSENHWTPVEVAVRVSHFLVSSSNTHVLDVGSGCGKFCTIAALLSGAKVVGIVQRPHLLSAARNAARKLRAYIAKFLFGNMANFRTKKANGRLSIPIYITQTEAN